MPLSAKKIDGKYRVVEKASGKVATNDSGTAIDGGGHGSMKEARAQATAVNLNQLKKKA